MAIEKITIPDFGDVKEITVVEVFVAPGDRIEKEASLIAMESEKAVMDLPSPFSGVIKEVSVKEEDVVTTGDVVALIETDAEASEQPEEQAKEAEKKAEPTEVEEESGKEAAQKAGGKQEKKEQAASEKPETGKKETEKPEKKEAAAEKEKAPAPEKAVEGKPAKGGPSGPVPHATPSVRAFAREQQIDLTKISGTGPKSRILKEDVLAAQRPTGPVSAEEPPLEDFSKYGEIEEVGLGRIKKISGPYLHRSWVTIPHVTHFDEADIEELERFRKELNGALKEDEPSYSPLVFVIRAVTATLKQFPLVNCSLIPGSDKVVVKKYYHLGIAVDTPHGLMVPVLKDADRRGFKDIAIELQRLSSSARAGKLAIPDTQGAGFTISSLGGIGGTGFTPIINGPQVAILGLSRSYLKPVWDGDKQKFEPRLTLPFSLSYDHRVIDGAEAARFCKALRMNIEDLKRTLVEC